MAATSRFAMIKFKLLAGTPALMKFEMLTLAELNRFIVDEEGMDAHFNSYDALKEMHDNHGKDRQYYTEMAENVMIGYVDELDDEQLDELSLELCVKDITSENQRLMKVNLVIKALINNYITTPSARQLKMMEIAM